MVGAPHVPGGAWGGAWTRPALTASVRRQRQAPEAGSHSRRFRWIHSGSSKTEIRDRSRACVRVSRLRACGVRAGRGGWTRYGFSIFDFDDRQGRRSQVVADGGVLGGRLRCDTGLLVTGARPVRVRRSMDRARLCGEIAIRSTQPTNAIATR